MTRREWLDCATPTPMLRFLLGLRPDQLRVADIEAFPDCKGSDRKLRLFACACYRRLWHLLPEPLARHAVAVAERFADGLATVEELEEADASLRVALDALEGPWRASRGAEHTALLPRHAALALAFQVTRPEAPRAAWYASSNAYLDGAALVVPDVGPSDPGYLRERAREERAQTDLLRCIFGPLPFEPLAIDPDWLAWIGGARKRLAEEAYEGRVSPDGALEAPRLAVLADALEGTGCADADLLLALHACRLHLRAPGPHVRGCHVVDLVRGTE